MAQHRIEFLCLPLALDHVFIGGNDSLFAARQVVVPQSLHKKRVSWCDAGPEVGCALATLGGCTYTFREYILPLVACLDCAIRVLGAQMCYVGQGCGVDTGVIQL